MATAHRGYEIRFSIGQIEHDPTVQGSVEELLAEAERVMGQ
jgi:diguanylate cyclase